MTFTETLAGGAAIEVYGGLTAADAYIHAMIGDGAVAYRALVTAADSDGRKRLLISATRYLDSLAWQSTPLLSGTTLQIPRDELTDAAGNDVGDAAQLALWERATFELVAIMAADTDTASAVDQGSNVQSMGAGSAQIAFWRPTSAADGTAPVLPIVLHRLIGRYLTGTGVGATPVTIGGASGGTCDESSFDSCDAYDRSGAF